AAVLYDQAKAAVFGRNSPILISQEVIEEIGNAIVAGIKEFHAAEPQADGADVGSLHKRFAQWLPGQAFLALIRSLASSGRLELHGTRVRARGHAPATDPEEVRSMQRVLQALTDGGFAP